jgi:hypothetical protein
MRRHLSVATAVFFFVALPGRAQELPRAPGAARKQARATRVANGSVRIDGRLDDQAWELAAPVTDFVQKEPVEGASPTEPMEVRIVYDDTAIYIGARMLNRERTLIQAPLARRDTATDQAEHILVSFDTFLDRRTAYAFGVTAAGVRIDRFYPGDDETAWDDEFDPVWEAKTSVGDREWTAELWIPFSQLRFTDRPEQIWGLNLKRLVPTLNEVDYWVAVPRTEVGWYSLFGDLRGIQGVRPPRRLELLPYYAGASTVYANRDLSNPFDDGRNLANRAGADLKLGLGPNLTLEATMNPDFGQVEADPAEVNLSVYETIFPEKRPFFTEGARLLNLRAVDNFYNSRRIGAPPTGPASGDFRDYPTSATILGAAKLTGRLPSGTSIGMLTAVTDEEFAKTANRDSLTIRSTRVIPRVSYGLARVQQEYGPSASTASIMVTAMHRSLDVADPLSALLARNAFTVSHDGLMRFKGGRYQLTTFGGTSYVDGEPAAIERIQRSSVRYLQRPDKNYAPLDPTRTSLPGYKLGGGIERTGGRHWLWNLRGDTESPGFEPNEFGRLRAGDGFSNNFSLTYRETQPGRMLRNYSISASQTNEWNYGGDRQEGSIRNTNNLTWRNFWTIQTQIARTFSALDERLTRGGPLMATPRGWNAYILIKSSAAARTAWNGQFAVNGNEEGGRLRRFTGGLSLRPGPRWEVSVAPEFSREVVSQQYIATIDSGRAATYSKRYVFGFVDRSTFSAQFRLNLTVRPDMNLDLYAEPFAASGRYHDFGELLAAGGRQRLLYGTSGTTIARQADGSRVVTDGSTSFKFADPDFNNRSFRSNLVLRWEWRPGSTLYLVWQQDRSESLAIPDQAGLRDMFGSLKAPGTNYFVVKTSFWVPIR